MNRRFRQLDVFGSDSGRGNPLAVVLDADDLDPAAMQAFAHWTNLSETTFLLPPTDPRADYRVRIFTAGTELPFAGHPTLGSAAAWLDAGGRAQGDVLVQECGAGLVEVGRDGDRLAFTAPPLTRHEPVDDALRERLLDGLGLSAADLVDAVWLVNGPQWIGVLLRDAETVLRVRPQPALLDGLEVGVAGPWGAGRECQLEVRAFLSSAGLLVEDPVTGSLNAGFAQWLTGTGMLPIRYLAAQGTVLGRAGRVHVERDGADVRVGGRAEVVVSGTVDL